MSKKNYEEPNGEILGTKKYIFLVYAIVCRVWHSGASRAQPYQGDMPPTYLLPGIYGSSVGEEIGEYSRLGRQ